MKARWYVRCNDCLSVAAIECDTNFHALIKTVKCGACAGQLEVMGKVQQDAMVTDVEERCPCDERCTCASGPNCNCRCGGEHHGTERVVEIEIIEGAPKLKVLEPEKARARVVEFGVALAEVEVKLPTAPGRAEYDAKKAGKWLNADMYAEMMKYVRVLNAIKKAQTMKTHGGRMRALAKLLP